MRLADLASSSSSNRALAARSRAALAPIAQLAAQDAAPVAQPVLPAAGVLAVCGLWSFPFLLHILVLVLERRFWHYCERANSSAEHAQERFKTLLGTFEASLGMYVLNKNFV